MKDISEQKRISLMKELNRSLMKYCPEEFPEEVS